jgi:hypothetical protein
MEGPEGEKGGRERRMTLRLRSALRLRLVPDRFGRIASPITVFHSTTPLHSTPCQRCKAMDNRDAIRDFCTSTGTTAVPRQSHCSTTPAHTASQPCTVALVALLATGTATEPHPEREPRKRPTTDQDGMLVVGLCVRARRSNTVITTSEFEAVEEE